MGEYIMSSATSLRSMGVLASIPSPPFNDFHVGPVRITFYGILIATGVALAWWLTRKRFEARQGDPLIAEKVMMRMLIFGFLGARLAYLSTNLDRFEGEWWKVIAIWEGGLALYGGLTVGAVTVLILNRRWGFSLGDFLDSLAPAVPIAQGFGRWGNYFNQELFGTPTDLPWGLEIAAENRPEQYLDAATFHPTFLYESLWNFALAGFIIWAGKRYPSLRGRLVGIYLVGYALIRFLTELIRTDTTFRFLGLSRNGWVSIGALVLGAVILMWKRSIEAVEPSADKTTN